MTCNCSESETSEAIETLYGMCTILAMHNTLMVDANTVEERRRITKNMTNSFMDLLPSKHKKELAEVLLLQHGVGPES